MVVTLSAPRHQCPKPCPSPLHSPFTSLPSQQAQAPLPIPPASSLPRSFLPNPLSSVSFAACTVALIFLHHRRSLHYVHPLLPPRILLVLCSALWSASFVLSLPVLVDAHQYRPKCYSTFCPSASYICCVRYVCPAFGAASSFFFVALLLAAAQVGGRIGACARDVNYIVST
jgi:hypothetical protein